MRRWIVVLVCACHGTSPPLYPAGSDRDDGHGILAQASSQFMTSEEPGAGLAEIETHRRPYGGNAYGGGTYGGSAYATYQVPAWPIAAPNRAPHYNQVPNLTGAIEGTIAMRGGKTACSEDVPRVALVYVEKVTAGRTLVNEGRPMSVGGTIVKRGCALAPIVQIVTPLPAAVAIHGDGKPAKLRVGGKPYELQAGGRVSLQVQDGVTRVDGDGLAPAWVVAIDTPYYALTDDRGRFRIDELAAGTYELTIWQPPANVGGEPTVVKRSVKVENRRAVHLDIK